MWTPNRVILRILMYLVMYDFEQVSLEHLLLSKYLRYKSLFVLGYAYKMASRPSRNLRRNQCEDR